MRLRTVRQAFFNSRNVPVYAQHTHTHTRTHAHTHSRESQQAKLVASFQEVARTAAGAYTWCTPGIPRES